jgi:uncharacterized membrane protein YoaK (UPF0700 family)
MGTMAATVSNERLATAVLSWVAGYVDTAGFLRLNGLFTAHVTGNLVVAGAELAGNTERAVWVRLGVIPVFIAAVVITSVIARTRQSSLSSLLWFEAATLLVFAGVGMALIPDRTQPITNMTMFIAGSAGVFAMGVRNALMRESLSYMAPTTVMTGNLTQFTIASTQLTLLRDLAPIPPAGTPTLSGSQQMMQIAKFGSALVGFVSGAVCGAFFMRLIGFWSILLPAIASALLAIYMRQQERSGRVS